ncbi:hypothetical protein MMC06_006591 [Schaereria dolodes]|nr:hypothetical protein [Schaereria dolodes]
MDYTGFQSAESLPGQSGSQHSRLRGKKEVTNSPRFRALVKRLSLPRSSIERPLSQQIAFWLNDPFSLAVPYGPTSTKSSPRHVPIVITPSLIESVLIKSSGSAIPQESNRRSSLQSAVKAGESQVKPLTRSRRKRHIPIVIPAFAEPYGISPTAERKSPGIYTPPYSPTAIGYPIYPSKEMSQLVTSNDGTSTLDSNISPPSPTRMYDGRSQSASTNVYPADVNSSQSSLNNDIAQETQQQTDQGPAQLGTSGTIPYATGVSPAVGQLSQTIAGTTNLSGLVCNVHKCTGKEPHALVGATTTILGDTLYVFGGRKVSRRRPQLTSDLYQLDLIRRHWTKVETKGDIPLPRYFHSVCALGDTKLVCYGGMSPASSQPQQAQSNASQQNVDQQPEVIVMSDVHVYDAPTRTWTYIPTTGTPQGRYAHCATILPSSAVFASTSAPLSAIHHNPSSSNPNHGSIGVALDGTGGAEMIVVGGQDSANQYIEQISVFNVRSLKWTATHSLGRSCGAYRSVVAPLRGMPASSIGLDPDSEEGTAEQRINDSTEEGSSMLIYSNYNFLDVKLELQVRFSDGSLSEKPMNGQFSPPGLRFPNGGVLDKNFVISGTYLTSSKQEYALWALDLKTLTWSRIDAGGSVFSQGSWNRGVLWSRRNTFVILGNRKRNLVEDYNHRRINFSNICMVELEAFGLYDNPRHTSPTSTYTSISAPVLSSSLLPKSFAWAAGGRPHFSAAEELGQMALNLRELADMDLLSVSGERIPVNSRLLARRWGPYFVQLLREGANSSSPTTSNHDNASSDVATLRAANHANSRTSSITITPSIRTNHSNATTLTAPASSASSVTNSNSSTLQPNLSPSSTSNPTFHPPTPTLLPPTSRSRALYLPHSPSTIHALLHYLYTSSLPPPTHALSTPQILCSLLQLARPYKIDGLLEAVVERLHQVMDGRNAAAVFNASAMAAGGGRGLGGDKFGGYENGETEIENGSHGRNGGDGNVSSESANSVGRTRGLRIETSFPTSNSTLVQRRDAPQQESDDEGSVISSSAGSMSTGSGTADSNGVNGTGEDGRGTNGVGVREAEEDIWSGEVSCVVGLQKRGLRGLMEGRRLRERGKSVGGGSGGGGGLGGPGTGAGESVGLGVA